MPKGTQKHGSTGKRGKTTSRDTPKKDELQHGKPFDPSAKSLRKNKEYLELKRNIALKG